MENKKKIDEPKFKLDMTGNKLHDVKTNDSTFGVNVGGAMGALVGFFSDGGLGRDLLSHATGNAEALGPRVFRAKVGGAFGATVALGTLTAFQLAQLKYYGAKYDHQERKLKGLEMDGAEIQREIERTRMASEAEGVDGKIATVNTLNGMEQVPPKS